MTPQEFKAWFNGFTEAIDKVPTKAQWERIRARVGEIDGRPITERVYVDRYWPQYHYYHPYYGTNWCGIGAATTGGAGIGDLASGNITLTSVKPTFDSLVGMNQLGRAEAISMGAA